MKTIDTEHPKVTYDEAVELLMQGDWISDWELNAEITNVINKWVEEYRKFIKEDSLSLGGTFSAVNDFDSPYGAAVLLISDHNEICDIDPESIPEKKRLIGRVKENAVIHIDKAARIILIDCVGLYFASLVTIGLPFLLNAWVSLNAVDLLSKLKDCYEVINEKGKQLVFEAIFFLQDKNLVVTNYDSLKAGDYKSAFSQSRPTKKEISDYLGSQLNDSEISKALQDLKDSKIIRQKKGRYSVDFGFDLVK